MDIQHQDLPSADDMLRAVEARDRTWDGQFCYAVTTTGVFCRPSCPARRPRPEHVQFFATPAQALFAGFRPCRRCQPLAAGGEPPEWASRLLAQVDAEPTRRLTDADLRRQGIAPAAARRYFKQSLGMTFQAYQRARRLGAAFAAIKAGGGLDEAALDHDWDSASGFRDAFVKAFGEPPGTARAGDHLRLGWLDTPLGPMVAGATDEALCLLEFCDRRMMETQLATLRRRFGRPLLPAHTPLFSALRDQLTEYFAGQRQQFDLPLDYPGTPFQARVWDALRRLPYGQTCSYTELAEAIGQPRAVRAVGHANGQNRLAILIPCHRVVASDGGLGGYGGGLWRKLRLLEREGGRPE